MIRATNFPLLLLIAFYERQAKVNGTIGFVETVSAAAERVFDTLPRHLRRLSASHPLQTAFIYRSIAQRSLKALQAWIQTLMPCVLPLQRPGVPDVFVRSSRYKMNWTQVHSILGIRQVLPLASSNEESPTSIRHVEHPAPIINVPLSHRSHLTRLSRHHLNPYRERG